MRPKRPKQDPEERQGATAKRLRIDLNGDRRLTEKVILEVQAAASRLGLEIANVEVIRKSSTSSRKPRMPASRRKPRARA